MRRTKNHAALSNPGRNPQFGRRWTEPPRCEGFKSIGELAAKVVDNTGRRAIAHWLNEAGGLDGEERETAFQIADDIRATMGLTWDEVIGFRRAA